jgi:hypothetical protein
MALFTRAVKDAMWGRPTQFVSAGAGALRRRRDRGYEVAASMLVTLIFMPAGWGR